MGGRVYDASGQRRMMYGQDLLRNNLTRQDPNDILRNAVLEWDAKSTQQKMMRDAEEASQIMQYVESQGLYGQDATKIYQDAIAKNPNLVQHMRAYAPHDTDAAKTGRMMDSTKLEMMQDPELARALAGDPRAKAEIDIQAKWDAVKKRNPHMSDEEISAIVIQGSGITPQGQAQFDMESERWKEQNKILQEQRMEAAKLAQQTAAARQGDPSKANAKFDELIQRAVHGARANAGDAGTVALFKADAEYYDALKQATNLIASYGGLGTIEFDDKLQMPRVIWDRKLFEKGIVEANYQFLPKGSGFGSKYEPIDPRTGLWPSHPEARRRAEQLAALQGKPFKTIENGPAQPAQPAQPISNMADFQPNRPYE